MRSWRDRKVSQVLEPPRGHIDEVIGLLEAAGGTAGNLVAGMARRLGWRGPFEPTEFVWSRGLALLCDHNGGRRFVREQRGGKGKPLVRLDPRAYAGVRDGDLLWVRATALPDFLDNIVPTLEARFVLVTGDEDWSIPGDFARSAELCAQDKLLCWFAQNYDGTDRSGKIFPLPIGLDFHTLSHRRRWGHAQATPQEQEVELEGLRAAMVPNELRVVRVHADFHFNKHALPLRGETRDVVEATLRSNPVVDFPPQPLPRSELWREKTRYAFVVSPHGNGLDCHRTWESLALGNIVIVKRSPLDPLYEGLPVVIVDQWSEITAETLREWHRQHCHTFMEREFRQRLTNRYWIERVRASAAERLSRDGALLGRQEPPQLSGLPYTPRATPPKLAVAAMPVSPSPSLCILTPTYRGDIEQFALLRESIGTFAPGLPHIALVQTEDYGRFRRRFGSERDFEILTTAEVLPREIERRRRKSGPRWLTGRSLRGPRIKGWLAQQLGKIFALAQLPYEAALFLDSDVFICRPLQAHDFYVDGRLKLFRQRAVNAEQLDFDISTHDLLGNPLHGVTELFDYIFHPACFRKSTASRLLEELVRRRRTESRWLRKFLQERRPSEYNLLGYAATVLEGAAHYELIECQPTDLHHSVRFPEDRARFAEEMRHMLSQPKQFALIQSTLGIDPGEIVAAFRALVKEGPVDTARRAVGPEGNRGLEG